MNEFQHLCPGCFQDKVGVIECSHCGLSEDERPTGFFLPYRSILQNRFLIGRELGAGGFGITYLALDINDRYIVAIKEFFPRALVTRETGHSTLVPISREKEDIFTTGLERFLMETRIMASFNHPNIVRVRGFFEENNTAYMVMDYYEGQSLGHLLKSRNEEPMPEKEVMGIIRPILKGLEKIHKKDILHRDIKPDNIYITTTGKPMLLDFGAARYVTSERSQNLTVVLTPDFAPFEQSQLNGRQGAWTDIYSCCATLYFMLSGILAPPATERWAEDTIVPLEETRPGITAEISAAVMQGLELRSDARPQTVDEFLRLLPPGKSPESSLKGKIFSLKCISGDYEGNNIQLDEPQLIIGRDRKKVNLFISDSEISRVHTQVWVDEAGDGLWVADCDSLNGTFRRAGAPGDANWQWIPIKGKELLAPGDRFRIKKDGDEFEIQVEFSDPKESVPGKESREYNIIKCTRCGKLNKVLLSRLLEEASCGNCKAPFEYNSRETDEHSIMQEQEEEVLELNGSPDEKNNTIPGWIIVILTAILLAIISALTD